MIEKWQKVYVLRTQHLPHTNYVACPHGTKITRCFLQQNFIITYPFSLNLFLKHRSKCLALNNTSTWFLSASSLVLNFLILTFPSLFWMYHFLYFLPYNLFWASNCSLSLCNWAMLAFKTTFSVLIWLWRSANSLISSFNFLILSTSLYFKDVDDGSITGSLSTSLASWLS